MTSATLIGPAVRPIGGMVDRSNDRPYPMTDRTRPGERADEAERARGADHGRRCHRHGPTRLVPRAIRPMSIVLAAVLTVAACGGADSEPAAVEDGSDDLAFTESDGDGDEDTTESDVDGAGGRDSGQTPTTAVGTTATTEGSGLPAVTTVPGSSGGDPQGLYRGIIGTLWPDVEVTEPVGDPPVDRNGIQPLTGRPGEVPVRPAAVVKVDNGSAALPQTGIDSADIVYEEEVEGGVTRLAAVFHSTSAIVGPVRSGRTTDVGVLGGLGTPLFLYSGANDVTEGIIRDQDFIRNRSFATSSGYWRDNGRRAPSDLMTDTAPHWASADPVNPPTQFAYRDEGEASSGDPVETLTVDHGATVARWEWDGSIWRRWQNGAEHRVVDGTQLTADNVVVVEVVRVDTGLVDASGGPVPEFVFVGTGPVTVYTDGGAVTGTWTRPRLNSVATLVDAYENPIGLTPGRTWVQIVEEGAGIVTTG